MKAWRTVARQPILDHGKFLAVENHTVELPDGQIIANWPWLVTPDYVNVAAVTEQGEFLCFRQTKYGIEGTSLAPVGGYLEPNEDPLAAAQRELVEETGYQATEWIDLGHFCVDGNRGAGTAHLFLAQQARWVKPAQADDLEEQMLLRLSRIEVEAALVAGEFKVLAWTTVMALALQRLKQ